jgi:hypothetical protein
VHDWGRGKNCKQQPNGRVCKGNTLAGEKGKTGGGAARPSWHGSVWGGAQALASGVGLKPRGSIAGTDPGCNWHWTLSRYRSK